MKMTDLSSMPPPPSLLADKTILKPIDKSVLVPRQRKRRAVVLDRCMECDILLLIIITLFFIFSAGVANDRRDCTSC